MKYMLLIYGNEHALSESERAHCYEESVQLAHSLKSNGQYQATDALYQGMSSLQQNTDLKDLMNTPLVHAFLGCGRDRRSG